jgi:S1-C subfamily serine protease
MIGQKRPGDAVTVQVARDSEQKAYRLILKNKSGTTDVVKKEESDNMTSLLGGSFRPVTTEEKDRLMIDYGLKVTGINDGKLAVAGIREGFIILRVDKIPIYSVEDLDKALNKASGGVLIEGIYPNGLRAYYGIGW